MAEYVSRYKDKTSTAVRRTSGYTSTRAIIGRKSSTPNKYGNFRQPSGGYKSKYYDPVARHERYLKERSSLGVGKGSGGGSGKGSGGGSSQNSNVAEEIAKLREESALSTAAQQEATKRKVEDLKDALTKRVQELREQADAKLKDTDNLTEVRGITQSLKKEIESLQGKTSDEIKSIGDDLQSWITNERDSLERRIAALYKSSGRDYKVTTQADKQSASESRDKEVSSRADSIYKKKS